MMEPRPLPTRMLNTVQFEDIEFMGVEHFDTYLSTKYGDYMTIPKHDEQRQHDFHYLDYHLPYREYDDQRVNMSADGATYQGVG